jgi:AraC family transcriptional regulator
MRSGAADILALALASGYGSHQAFTRAFRAQFGVTPERVRRLGSTDTLTLVSALDMVEEGRPDIESARLEAAGPFTFVGLSARHTFSATHHIPAQWRQFMEVYGDIPDKSDPIPVGVTSPIDLDEGFDYLCGAQISPRGRTPAGLTGLDIPVRDYAVFPHRDHVATIRSTYVAIWNDWLPERGWQTLTAPILERHNPTFDVRTGYGGLEIWIPIARDA